MAVRLVLTYLIVIICSGCQTTRKTSNPDPSLLKPSRVEHRATTEPVVANDSQTKSLVVQPISHQEVPIAEGEQTPEQHSVFSLQECVERGLSHNPDLVAIRETDAVGRAALGVAQRYPFNPYVQIQVTPYQAPPSGGPGITNHYVLMMQNLQLAHQQRYREEGAWATLDRTQWNIHQTELQTLTQTLRLYFIALHSRGVHHLSEETLKNHEMQLTTARTNQALGKITPADFAVIQVETNTARMQTQLLHTQSEAALREVKRHLGIPIESPFLLQGELVNYQWRKPTAWLLSEGDFSTPEASHQTGMEANLIVEHAEIRPDVMLAHAEVEQARAGLSLAHAARTPDLQLGPYYQRSPNGTYFLGFRAQMDLPVNNNGRPLEQQRLAELHQRQVAWEQARERAKLEAHAAWERFELARSTLETFEQQELPELKADLLKDNSVPASDAELARLIRRRNSIIQNQRLRLDLHNELAQAASNLVGATGIPIESLLDSLPSGE